MQVPSDNFAWIKDDEKENTPAALDVVDDFYVQFRLVDQAMRGNGLGTALFEQLKLDAENHADARNKWPATISTNVLKFGKYKEWYDRKLGFVRPEKFEIVQVTSSADFNLMYVPKQLEGKFRRSKNILAKPCAAPLAKIDGPLFETFCGAQKYRTSRAYLERAAGSMPEEMRNLLGM